MKSPDSHFEDLLRKLPQQKLSRSADRHIKAMIRQRCREESGSRSFWDFSALLRPLFALPMALALLLVTTSSYSFMSPAVVKGDMLYGIKTRIETAFYPSNAISERRVNYHLWLSDRRYSEVDEILTRLDADEYLTLIPQAQAQELSDADVPLHDVLMETLQSATQHVDLAFLIVDEVEEVDRVESLKESLKVSLQNQKNFMTKVSPALQEIKMKKKMRPRLRRLEREQIAQERLKDQMVEESLLAQAEAVQAQEQDQDLSVVASSVPIEDHSRADEEIDEYQLSKIDQGIPTSRKLPTRADVELAVLSEYINDRLAFQESLLASMDDTVAFAKASGVRRVDLSVDQEISTEEVLQESDPSETVSEPIIRQALVVHFNAKQKLIQIEIAQIKQSQVQQKVEILEDILSDPEPDDEDNSVDLNAVDTQEDEISNDSEPVEVDIEDQMEESIQVVAVSEPVALLAEEDEDNEVIPDVETEVASLPVDEEEEVSVLSVMDVDEDVQEEVENGAAVLDSSELAVDEDILAEESLVDELEKLLSEVSDMCREEAREACREDVTTSCVSKAVEVCESVFEGLEDNSPSVSPEESQDLESELEMTSPIEDVSPSQGASAPGVEPDTELISPPANLLPQKKIDPVIQIEIREVKPKVVDTDEERLNRLEGDLKNAEMHQQTLQQKSLQN